MPTIISRLLLCLLFPLLAACTVAVEEPGPGPRPIPDGGFCTREYAPVCARRGGSVQTFGNGCMARASGYRVIGRGECGRRDEPRFCTREYRPVCAVRRGNTRTFPNACEARAANYRVIDRGRC